MKSVSCSSAAELLNLCHLLTGCQEAQVSGWLKTYAAASAQEEAGQSKLLQEAATGLGGGAACPAQSLGGQSI